jgi:hypothetical protein
VAHAFDADLSARQQPIGIQGSTGGEVTGISSVFWSADTSG